MVYRAPEEVVPAVLAAGVTPEQVRVVEHEGVAALRIDLVTTEAEERQTWERLAAAVRAVGGGGYTRVVFAIRSPDRRYWRELVDDISRDMGKPSMTVSADAWSYEGPPPDKAPF